MAFPQCDKWELVGKKLIDTWKARLNATDWDSLKDLLAQIVRNPFEEDLGRNLPGPSPLNNRCAFVPGTNIVVTWLITLRQCTVTIMEIEDAGSIDLGSYGEGP